jgi:hypothetical protein
MLDDLRPSKRPMKLPLSDPQTFLTTKQVIKRDGIYEKITNSETLNSSFKIHVTLVQF